MPLSREEFDNQIAEKKLPKLNDMHKSILTMLSGQGEKATTLKMIASYYGCSVESMKVLLDLLDKESLLHYKTKVITGLGNRLETTADNPYTVLTSIGRAVMKLKK